MKKLIKHRKSLFIACLVLSMFIFGIHQVTVKAPPTYWFGYIRDNSTQSAIEDATVTLRFGLYAPPWYVWGNDDTTNSQGYFSVYDDIPEDWGATFLYAEADGYAGRFYEVPADENFLGGGPFTIKLFPIEK